MFGGGPQGAGRYDSGGGGYYADANGNGVRDFDEYTVSWSYVRGYYGRSLTVTTFSVRDVIRIHLGIVRDLGRANYQQHQRQLISNSLTASAGGVAVLLGKGLWEQTQGGDYPFYTHEKIITAAFEGKLNDRQINQIIKGSVYADSKRFQDEEHSYMHAMRSRTQAATQAEAQMWNFVTQQAQRFER